MTTGLNRLKPLQIAKAKPGERLADGGGLYLICGKGNGATKPKSWAFFYYMEKKRRELGLGPLEDVTVEAARALAATLRAAQARGLDPASERDRLRAEAATVSAPAEAPPTFRQVALDYIASKREGWRNRKHRGQWEATLETYVYPVLGDLPVGEVDTSAVLRVLQPIWTLKPETANRVRGRIEAVLSFATFKKLREGSNPALWRGGLSHVLPSRAKVRAVAHHPALPYAKLPAFMNDLAQQQGLSAVALRFTVLTATRTGEALGACWSEIDEASATWTIPAGRSKVGREHRVALSSAVLDLLKSLPRVSDHVFPGLQPGRPLLHTAMLDLLPRLGAKGITVHGFRSTFKDWASDQTTAQWEVSEACLGHTVGAAVERAYGRSDLFEKRRGLMEAWGRFACGAGLEGVEAPNVVRLACLAAVSL